MATQYSPLLKLALPVTGELSGTWGDVVNDNITSMIEQAVAGLATINVWTANSHTLTTANGTTSESRCAMLVAADGAGGTALTAAGEIICPATSKLYVVRNGSSYAVTLKTSGGTGIAVPTGQTAFLFCDGTNVNACVTTIVNGNVSGNLTVGGNLTVNGNTTLGDANTDTITATGRFNTDLLPSTDNARDLGSSGNSWKDLYLDGTAYLALVDINGGAIDGVSIGVTTPATVINVDNLSLNGNTISSTDTNGNIVLAPNGTGDVQLDADTLRVGDSNAAATITTNGTGNLTLSTNAGTNSGTIVINQGTNGNIVLAPNGTGDVQLDADTVRVGDLNTDVFVTTNGTGNLNLTTNGGTNSGTIQIAQGINGNITLTPNGTGFVSIPKVDIDGGAIDGTVIGGVSAAAGTFTTATATDVNATTVDTTNIEVTNIKAKDGTAAASIADSTGIVTITTQLTVDNININTNTISSTNSNGNIVLAPNGTGDVYVDADTLRVGDSNAAATITTNGTGNLTLSTNAGTNSGTIVINQGTNGNIVLAPNGTGDVYLDADTLRVGDSNAAATITTNGTGNLTLSTNTGTNSGTIVINQGTNGNIAITPNGTGEVDISKVDIDGGTIDGTVIGGTTRAAGSFTTLDANGNVTLGDATSDTITATGRFNTDLVPSTDNARSLGTAALKWSNVFSTAITENGFGVVSQTDLGTAPNEIPLNQYLGNLAYQDTETPALDVGTGITTGTGTICRANGGSMGGIYRMSILIDLTGLNSGGTAGDIIGVNGTALPCYIAQLPAMTVLGGRMTCLETPAGGDTDIDLYSATEGTGVEDQDITTLTETQIINAGAQTVGTVTYFAADPAANTYFYLVGQGTSDTTYTAGRFLIEIFGV